MASDRDQARGTTLEDALRWLREHNRYILDKWAFRPKWGVPGEVPKPTQDGIWGTRK